MEGNYGKMAVRSHSPMGRFSLLSGAERRRVLHEFNDTAVSYPQDQLIHEVFEAQARRTPEATALICGDQQLTYAQLDRRGNGVAHALLAHHVMPDQRVGLYAERSLDAVVGMLGALKAGCAYVPLDPAYPIERLKYMLGDSEPAVLLAQADLLDRIPSLDKPVVVLGRETEYSNESPLGSGLSPRNLAYVVYTSGSTGRPKGVLIEHRSVLRLVINASYAEINHNDCIAHCASSSFDATTWEVWAPLLNGARVLIVPQSVVLDAPALNEALVRHSVTALWLTVGLFNEYVDVLEEAFSRLRYLITGGDALNVSTVLRALSKPAPPLNLINGYGPTETTTFATTFLIRELQENARSVPIGRPIENTRVYILDSNREPVPIGMAGEIHVGGPGVARGYLNQAALTTESFIPDPFDDAAGGRLYRTGDLGRWRSDGNIEFLGRNDHQVKIRGFRVELGEIEVMLRSCPGVKEAVAVARQDVSGDKRLAAYVVADVPRLKAEQESSADRARTGIVGQWKELYENTYSEQSAEPTFIGWNSSYTGRQIPEEHMKEWLETTLERISALRPRKVLEIGCGVGLLAERLAPGCETYVATDFSEEAIRRMRGLLHARPELQHVQLKQCTALDLDGPQLREYDTVILNSVVQYFPDIDYLWTVIARAVNWLSPGGHIFIGDVRHFGLLKAFHSSVQLTRAADELTVKQLKIRVEQAVELEKELLIDPLFFENLPHSLPGIECADVSLKRGCFDNELTRYRYDVVLRVGDFGCAADPDRWMWETARGTVDELATRMAWLQLNAVRICGVPNRRLTGDVAVAKLMEEGDESRTCATLRVLISRDSAVGEEPDEFRKIGEVHGYDVKVSWTPGSSQGCFDVQWMVRSSASKGATHRNCASAGQQSAHVNERSDAYANDPLGRSLKQQLIRRLREHLGDKMPPFMVPGALMVLDALPLTSNGKVDRRRLPLPDAVGTGRKYEAPNGQIEKVLAGVWQDLLRVDRVGRQDNFFELGGHSLLIVQMMARLRRVGLAAEVRSVLQSPTLIAMARELEESTGTFFAVPPNLIQPGCEVITPQMLPLIDLEPEHIERIVQAVPGGVANIQDIYPLAPLQEGILFHYLMNEREGDTYVVPVLLSLSSRAKLDEFINALRRVIDRHDVLRTAVFWEYLPQAVQVVHRRVALRVEEIILDEDGDPIEQLRERMKPERLRLDLRKAPLVRLQIAANQKTGKWYALLQLHHLVCDGQSAGIVVDETAMLMEDRFQQLPEPVAYRIHVAQALAHSRAHDSEEFFRTKLADVDEPTTPFGLADVHGVATRLNEGRCTLGEALAEKLREQASRWGVSAATLFHAAWALVVSLTSGRDDVVYGTVLLGRLQGSAGAQRVLGMFINTLPLRLRLHDTTARELVDQTQREIVGLLSHEQASLAVAQRCSRVPASIPLFTTLLNYRHAAHGRVSGWGDTAGIEEVASETWTNYPITILVDDEERDFVLTVQSAQEIDPHRLARTLLTATTSLVEALERAPDTPALHLSILPDAERRQVIDLFNVTNTAYPRDKLIHELFEEQAQRTPQNVAVAHGDRTLTYSQLNEAANQLARYLIDKGVGPDQTVAACMERSLEMVVALLAILKSGGAYVPIDPTYPQERLQYMLRDANPRVLLTQRGVGEKLPQVVERIFVDSDWSEIGRRSASNISAKSLGLRPDNLAYVIYTSGSTGRPKGAMNEHRGVVNRLLWMQDRYRLGSGDRVLQKTPFGFDVSVWEFFWTLMTGARLIMARPEGHKDPGYLQELIDETRVTTLHFVPSMLQVFLDHLRDGQCSSLKRIVSSGEELSAALQGRCLTKLPGVRLSNLYGPTEAAVDVTAWECAHDDRNSKVPIGCPIANIRIYVLDRHARAVPVGVTGEIHIGGVGVGRGYLNRPELTAERFVRDPFTTNSQARMYKTGDLGRWRPDGSIEYLGRNDYQVKIRGFRIELTEIEARLIQHPRINEAVVILREDVAGEKRLAAYVVPSAEDHELVLNIEQIRDWLQAALPDYMIPSVYVLLERMPLSANGKLDRRALPVPERGTYLRREYEAPQGEIEMNLAEIWQELLNVDRVGRQDDFFELGGHSLRGIKLMVSIARQFCVDMPLNVVFQRPTIEQMARVIASLRGDESQSVSDERGEYEEGAI